MEPLVVELPHVVVEVAPQSFDRGVAVPVTRAPSSTAGRRGAVRAVKPHQRSRTRSTEPARTQTTGPNA